MRPQAVVLVLAALLLGSGLAWLVVGRSATEQPPAVSPNVVERPAEPVPPAVDLARPATMARIEPGPGAPVQATPAPERPAQPAPPKQGVSMRPWPDYEAMTQEQIEAELERLRSELGEITHPLLVHRLEAGLGELLAADTGEGFSYQGRKSDNATIMMVHCEAKGGAAYRVELPRAEHPDLYEVKDLMLRLQKLAAEKRRAAWSPR